MRSLSLIKIDCFFLLLLLFVALYVPLFFPKVKISDKINLIVSIHTVTLSSRMSRYSRFISQSIEHRSLYSVRHWSFHLRRITSSAAAIFVALFSFTADGRCNCQRIRMKMIVARFIFLCSRCLADTRYATRKDHPRPKRPSSLYWNGFDELFECCTAILWSQVCFFSRSRMRMTNVRRGNRNRIQFRLHGQNRVGKKSE